MEHSQQFDASAAPAFVDVENVSLRYGEEATGTLAIKDATLAIGDTEFIALVGPSGCGKSSLLKLVSGLHPPIAGTVRVAGKPVTRPIDICGIAFQNSTLLPWRTTLENVLLPLEIVEPYASSFRRKRAEYVDRAKELLAAVGLAGFEERYPWELSGGMQQRANLCRALIHRPRLLLLDEPFGALDAFTREDLWAVLQDLCAKEKPTVILVTHELREAVFLADTVYVVSPRPGRIIRKETVPFPRPRTYEMTFQPEFVDLVHSLRENIHRG